MPAIIHEDWLNQNRNRRYPFWDAASLQDTTGTLTIPNELITDLIFPVNVLSYDPAKFFLAELTVFAGGVILSLGYEGAGVIATRSITELGHTENKPYAIEGIGDFFDSVGRINIGRFDDIKQFGGTYTFTAAASRLLPAVMRPSLKGVTGLKIINADNEESALLQGDIELVQGDNITLELLAGNKLRISAVNNPGFDQLCDCPDDTAGPCIETINNVPPDSGGNIELLGTGCLTIDNSGTARIVLEDTCAEPCCGCQELDVLRTEGARLGSPIATQRSAAERALGTMDQLRDVILASKFGSASPC